MNRFKQHFPNFCAGFNAEEQDFDTIEQLKENEVVKKWLKQKHFYRLSLSDNALMAELKEGKEWWVIGYLKEPVDLPIWEIKR